MRSYRLRLGLVTGPLSKYLQAFFSAIDTFGVCLPDFFYREKIDITGTVFEVPDEEIEGMYS